MTPAPVRSSSDLRTRQTSHVRKRPLPLSQDPGDRGLRSLGEPYFETECGERAECGVRELRVGGGKTSISKSLEPWRSFFHTAPACEFGAS
jgi:hypothetical protein